MRQIQSILRALFLFLLCTNFCFALSEINIAYVKSPFNLQNMVLKEKRILEKEFQNDGIRIKWHDINSGAVQSQALASKSLDVTCVMNTASLLLGASAGNPLCAITGVAHPTGLFALVGKAGPRMSIRELKGKIVAAPRGTVMHQILIAALKKEGMTMKDIRFVSMSPDKGYAALVAGAVDVAALAAGLVVKANALNCQTIVTADGLLLPNLVMVARKDFIEKHPAIIKRLVKAHRATFQWIQDNKNDALTIAARIHKLDRKTADLLYDASYFYDVLDASDIQGLKEDQNFLFDNGLMRQKIDVNTVIYPTALR